MSRPHDCPSRAAALEALDDVPVSPKDGETIGDVIARRYSRRDIMKGALGVTAATAVFGPAALAATETTCAFVPEGFQFDEIEAGIDNTHRVADGYSAKFLISWGDPIHTSRDTSPFDPDQLRSKDPETRFSGPDQQERFGYNNDYIAYFPIDKSGNYVEDPESAEGSDHGLLCINHEYADGEMMFPGVRDDKEDPEFETVDDWMAEVEMEAVGVTVLKIKKDGDDWRVVESSPYNRRITVNTEMTYDGPVRDNPDRFTPRTDGSGTNEPWDKRTITGTYANCAGGRTPWGTYLTAEENIHYPFWTTEKRADGSYALEGTGASHLANYRRYKIPLRGNAWGRTHPRFDVDKEPNEPNRFGWIVEIDPFDKKSIPVKHTALGRFFHEGAETVLSNDKRAVVFSGDDARNEYVYRFVSEGRYRPGKDNKSANMELLSRGTLAVAKFNDDGTGRWITLERDSEEFSKARGAEQFNTQADVVIDARMAADTVKATRMDRPEDVQPNEKTRRVYVMLTNNTARYANKVDKANPRANNKFGHIIEICPEGGDFGAEKFTWDILVRCGDPEKVELGAYWNAATTRNSWFVSPDNAAVDDQGRLWIATDQGKYWPDTGHADGLYALETHGVRRGMPRMFFRVPAGAELCGPCFTPDGETLFLSVQHPAADGMKGYRGLEGSNFDKPAHRWPNPDGNNADTGMPPRPTVMAITKKGGGKIGG